jgi:hypothetical protein
MGGRCGNDLGNHDEVDLGAAGRSPPSGEVVAAPVFEVLAR